MELFREGTSIPLKGIPTLSFLKRKRGMEYGLLIAGALLFILIAILEAHSLTLGPYFIVVLLLGGLLLYGSSHLVLPSLSRIRPWWISFGTRHGLSNLSRPGLRPYSAIAALGLTALLLGILSVYQFSLLKDLDPGQRVEALPNFFLIDIQTDQVESLEIFLKERGVRDFVLRPMVKARYRGLNGQGFGDEKSLTREDERAEWARNREQNLSYRTELSADETLLKGRWLDPNSQEIEASLEKGYAERLGADVGDVLTFDVQGVEINAKVTSIRKIQWSSFRPNFFILISPKVLEDAPQVWVGSISGMDKPLRDTVQADIVHLFPNITLFDVAQTSQQILRILDRIIWAIRFIALFSLGAGLVVLVGIALSTARQRQMDAVLLKVLGAGRRTLLASIATEFGLLGAVSSLAGLVLAVGFGWLLLAWFLEIRFAVPWPQLLAIFVGLTVICALAGILTCQRILRAKPLEVLREG
jgi:putative ABC transport system permease protein